MFIHPEPGADPTGVTWEYLAGTQPAFFPPLFYAPSLFNSPLCLQLVCSVVLTLIDLIIDRTKKTGSRAELREWSLIMGGGGGLITGGVGEVQFYHYEKGVGGRIFSHVE